MGLVDDLLSRFNRADPRLPFDEWVSYFGFNHNGYTFNAFDQTMAGGKVEDIDHNFGSYISQAYKANGIIFACELTRIQLFSQARFQFQSFVKGQPNKLFGTPDLDILAHPWANATTGDLLSRMAIHADFGGNSYVTKRRSGVKCMRPDWVTIIHGSPNDREILADDLDAELMGYAFYPGGRNSGREPVYLLPEEVAHYAPIPDPMSPARGMSWLTPIVREIMGDQAATDHKLRFFENGATPNLVVKRPDSPNLDVFKEWVKMMDAGHTGAANAYKTLYLTAGSDATVVGRDMQQLEFKVTQGAGETRIAAAAGVHPVIVGLSEGMQGSSLNAGNFNSARRLVADKTLWHLWSNVAGSLESIVPPPPGSRLWVDDRAIPFLREDRKDAAEIQQLKAATIRQLVDAGYEADTVVDAVDSEDMTLLVHSGLFSVQLQPPKTAADIAADKAAALALTAPAEPVPAEPNGKTPVAPGVKP